MRVAGVGRILAASLHEAIADELPTRLEFYEHWLNPQGLRHGQIGLGALVAVLSFLRREGERYELVMVRAGYYAATWVLADRSPTRRAIWSVWPASLRARGALRLARRLVRESSPMSSGASGCRRGEATLDIRESVFCGVRETVDAPLCRFYAAAVERLFEGFRLKGQVRITRCRAVGSDTCQVAIVLDSFVGESHEQADRKPGE